MYYSRVLRFAGASSFTDGLVRRKFVHYFYIEISRDSSIRLL